MKCLIDLDSDSWVDIKGYEGLYKIHPSGSVCSVDRLEEMTGRHPNPYKRNRRGRMLIGRKGNAGYLQVGLYRDGVCKRFLIHRLVAEHFIPNPENKPEVNHLDERRTNNRVENLEWSTRSENALHSSYKNRGSRSGKNKLHENEVEDIVKYLKQGVSQTELASWYGVTNHTIHKIKSGKNWQWLTGLGKEVENEMSD